MNEASHSHFSMFRATIALAWVDHQLDEKEVERILVYIKNNKQLSDAQREKLKQELHQPVKLDDVWSDISDVQDRAHLINIADAIFWEDGEMCHTEREVYEKIKDAHMSTLDLDFIREDIAAHRKELAANRQQFKEELHEIQMRGPFGRMMHYLETMVDKVL